jgi:hypothetical protein
MATEEIIEAEVYEEGTEEVVDSSLLTTEETSLPSTETKPVITESSDLLDVQKRKERAKVRIFFSFHFYFSLFFSLPYLHLLFF